MAVKLLVVTWLAFSAQAQAMILAMAEAAETLTRVPASFGTLSLAIAVEPSPSQHLPPHHNSHHNLCQPVWSTCGRLRIYLGTSNAT